MAVMRSLGSLLREGTEQLERVSGSARLDSELLLAHALGLDRAALYARTAETLQAGAAERFRAFLAERATGKPVAQIVGRREFFSLEFEVTHEVLVPRPETELLVEVIGDGLRTAGAVAQILELGTGCGAVAIALSRSIPHASVVASDISRGALAVARRNARRLSPGRIDFVQGSWYAPLDGGRFDAIVCNPPYVQSPLCGDAPLCFEPRSALDGGPDGLRELRRLISGAPAHLNPGGMLAVEHGPDQGRAVRSLMRSALLKSPLTHRDLAGHERVTAAHIEAEPHQRAAEGKSRK